MAYVDDGLFCMPYFDIWCIKVVQYMAMYHISASEVTITQEVSNNLLAYYALALLPGFLTASAPGFLKLLLCVLSVCTRVCVCLCVCVLHDSCNQ